MSTGSATTGSGSVGALRTPTDPPEEEPPTEGQEANFVVNGVGLANVADDEELDEKARES